MLDVTREPQPGTFSPPLLTTIPGHSGATLTVLLDRIARRPGRPTAMLRTTAAHLARYRGAPATDLKCDATLAALPGFATWFGRIARKNACPLTYSSVQSNLNHARIPLATARESGCKLTPILADLTWRPVFFRGSSCEAALCPADHAARSTRLLVPRSECIPSDQLTVDLLHSAVRLLYEDEGATPLVAPGVRVLNLSIGDPSRTLDGPMSPLPRMIDWLSWRYRVLFLVSAGNANSPLELDVARADVAALDAAGLPYHVLPGRNSFVESSARSRGFKFALISALAANLAEANQVVIPESGQGALGPALVPVGQAYEDYRSHPLFTCRMERFVNALFSRPVSFSFPRLWHTKGETLKQFVEECDDRSSWSQTRSCWQQSRQVSVAHMKRQCGICAACMLRRLSVQP